MSGSQDTTSSLDSSASGDSFVSSLLNSLLKGTGIPSAMTGLQNMAGTAQNIYGQAVGNDNSWLHQIIASLNASDPKGVEKLRTANTGADQTSTLDSNATPTTASATTSTGAVNPTLGPTYGPAATVTIQPQTETPTAVQSNVTGSITPDNPNPAGYTVQSQPRANQSTVVQAPAQAQPSTGLVGTDYATLIKQILNAQGKTT